ncbi:MAG: putative glycoside hydrolase [Candidatus Sericytochromatia bacterium]|nr:putative glycoside hydrolase [Candidatus Sericytochromatia bacterium]
MSASHSDQLFIRVIAILCAGGTLGCPKTDEQSNPPKGLQQQHQQTRADISSPAKTATGPILKTRQGIANELGFIPVLEYHRFGPKEERWTRTPENFRKDLNFLYNNNYYLLNMADVAQKQFLVPAGKKPVVLTFDDSTDGQFRYLKDSQGGWKTGADGKKVVDPDCAVGMLDTFCATHPDFGRGATFYVLPSGFDQAGVIGEKFRHLVNTGREIGNHTWSHESLRTMSSTKIENHLGKLQAFVSKEIGRPYPMTTLALPFGIGPRDAAGLKKVVSGGAGETAYRHAALLLVGSNPAYSPYDRSYKATGVARIQCIDSEFKNWFNRQPGSTAPVKESWQPFVSDGDPVTVSFPQTAQERFNAASLPTGQKTNSFDPAKTAAHDVTKDAAASPVALTSSGEASPRAAGISQSLAADVPVETVPATASISHSNAPETASDDKNLQPPGLDHHPGYNKKLPPGGEYQGGTIRHRVAPGDSVEAIAWRYLRYTDYYTYPKLATAIRSSNQLNRPLKIGEWLNIPQVRQAPPAPALVKRDKTFPANGVYITGTTAGSESLWRIVSELKKHGGNTVVFDAKDMNGAISYNSDVPLARELKAYGGGMIHDLPKMVERLHREGIHTVARLVLFHDMKLARKKPQYALKSKRTGGVWREAGNLAWVDASLPAVQDYNLALAHELVKSGVDEIQFDYVRFPAQGETSDIDWRARKDNPEKHPVITAWLKRARESLGPTGVLISADVYGVVAWEQSIDVKITGQRLEDMGHQLDVISPMLYPSHFYKNFDNLAYPPDHPEHFIGEGVKKVAQKTAGSGVAIRPWLQAFPYRIRNYGPAYVARQIRANRDAQGTGFLLWNAENNYTVGFAGISEAGTRNARVGLTATGR